jgi:hypothetical protein
LVGHQGSSGDKWSTCPSFSRLAWACSCGGGKFPRNNGSTKGETQGQPRFKEWKNRSYLSTGGNATEWQRAQVQGDRCRTGKTLAISLPKEQPNWQHYRREISLYLLIHKLRREDLFVRWQISSYNMGRNSPSCTIIK